MLTRKLLPFIVIFFVSGCVVIPTYKARISLIPTREYNSEVQVKDLLIIGTGSVASQIFLENLSAEMKQSLQIKGIQADFSYMGKIPDAADINIDKLKQDKYDSYLVFMANNESYLDMTKEKFTGIGPGVTATGYGNQYVETFTVVLYNGKVKHEVIWQGKLAVDFDIANNSRYKQISGLIFNEFTKSHILLN